MLKDLAFQFLLDTAMSAGNEIKNHPAGYVSINPNIQWPIFNYAILGFSEYENGTTSDMLKQMNQMLASHNRKPSYLINVDIESLIGANLQDLGLNAHEKHTVYFASAESVTEVAHQADIIIQGAEEPSKWLELLLDGFEVPEHVRQPFREAHSHLLGGDKRAHLFEAVIDGVPAGAAMLWLQNGIAGLNTATVKPSYRRVGVYKALYNARVRLAKSLEADWLATETAQPAVSSIVERCGFSEVISFKYWY